MSVNKVAIFLYSRYVPPSPMCREILIVRSGEDMVEILSDMPEDVAHKIRNRAVESARPIKFSRDKNGRGVFCDNEVTL